MKKLISLKEVANYHEEGVRSIFVDSQTIITPAAKDLAEEYQIELKETACSEEKWQETKIGGCSTEDLIALLKRFLAETKEQPYEASYHKNGLKIVKGDTVKLQPDKGNERIKRQKIVRTKERDLTTELISLEQTCYSEQSDQDSVNYIISGEVELLISGERFVASQGDTIFIPQNTSLDWNVKDKAYVLATKGKQLAEKAIIH